MLVGIVKKLSELMKMFFIFLYLQTIVFYAPFMLNKS
jgi:hypothetical protein